VVTNARRLTVGYYQTSPARRDKLPRPWRRDEAGGRYAQFGEATMRATSDSSWNASKYEAQLQSLLAETTST
jgi:hypothetical protein